MLYTEYLTTLHSCPFCEDKNRNIVEEELAYLTYAKAPYHPHHLLVIPKRHVEHVHDLTSLEEEAIDRLLDRGIEILTNLGHKNYTILVRDGDGTGKSIRHLHYHLIPDIHIGSLDHEGEPRKVLTEEELNLLKKELIRATDSLH